MEPNSAIDSVIEYVKGERDWVACHTVACDLERLGRLAPESWPRHPVEYWLAAVNKSIKDGLVVFDGHGRVKFKPPEPKQKVESQLSLFD